MVTYLRQEGQPVPAGHPRTKHFRGGMDKAYLFCFLVLLAYLFQEFYFQHDNICAGPVVATALKPPVVLLVLQTRETLISCFYVCFRNLSYEQLF